MFWRCRILISTTHCKRIQSSQAYPPTTSHHMCTEELLMNHSGCFDLPEIPKVFVQGFSGVHCCNVRQGKVLQLWEMSKSCSLQNTNNHSDVKKNPGSIKTDRYHTWLHAPLHFNSLAIFTVYMINSEQLNFEPSESILITSISHGWPPEGIWRKRRLCSCHYTQRSLLMAGLMICMAHTDTISSKHSCTPEGSQDVYCQGQWVLITLTSLHFVLFYTLYLNTIPWYWLSLILNIWSEKQQQNQSR